MHEIYRDRCSQLEGKECPKVMQISKLRTLEPVPPVVVAIPQHWAFVQKDSFTRCGTRAKRPIDVMFSGNVYNYGDKMVIHHRKRCCASVRNLSSIGLTVKVSEQKLPVSTFVDSCKPAN